MESLSPMDAILFPLFTGIMLVGLYFLIKWLKDPEILNKILNWYLSGYGVFSIARLLTDCMNTMHSFAFPTRFTDDGVVWQVKAKQRIVAAEHVDPTLTKSLNDRTSPLPGVWSRLPLPPSVISTLWNIREKSIHPLFVMEAYLRDNFEAAIDIGPHAILGFFCAVVGVLYFNLVDKPWWLTNLLGFSFSYSALQLMSPTTFWTGTLVLSALFFYDIYFVFFTPVMIEVATKLDIPVKLLFPRPSGEKDDPTKQALAMLGLGDIVLPGIMIGLALRFDLYLFYLRKQKVKDDREENITNQEPAGGKKSEADMKSLVTKVEPEPLVYDHTGLGKVEFVQPSGNWGERFWLSSGVGGHSYKEGGAFPKPYFYASVTGYTIGLLCILGVMHVFQHGQPALLYLVPGVLVSLWTTALVKGDLKTMWEYTEEEQEDKAKKEKEAVKEIKSGNSDDKTKDIDRTKKPPDDGDSTKKLSSGKNESDKPDGLNLTVKSSSIEGHSSKTASHDKNLIPPKHPDPNSPSQNPSKKSSLRLFSLSISLPPSSSPERSQPQRKFKDAKAAEFPKAGSKRMSMAASRARHVSVPSLYEDEDEDAPWVSGSSWEDEEDECGHGHGHGELKPRPGKRQRVG